VSTQPVVVILNPVSGTGGRPHRARRLAAAAAGLLGQRGGQARVLVTERPGHARELAAEAVCHGAETVVAWGGDGTVNEVASALVGTSACLAIVPAGSGNGLARGLALPTRPDRALDVALTGDCRLIDTGDVNGVPFMNVAGVGLDACIAKGFSEVGRRRRGFRTYVGVTIRELLRYTATEHHVVTEASSVRLRPLLLAFANGPQYGNGACIAPDARVDDGWLDLVLVEERSALRALVQVPALFAGRAERIAGVQTLRTRRITVTSDTPILFHVDGEPGVGGTTIEVRVHPGSLRVRVPMVGLAQSTNR
jgi:YegS/Rv2252/BmrU family lipid kinase